MEGGRGQGQDGQRDRRVHSRRRSWISWTSLPPGLPDFLPHGPRPSPLVFPKRREEQGGQG
eukprot:1756227-Pyramimonas_sp.AAC.1